MATFAIVTAGTFCLLADSSAGDTFVVHLKHGRSMEAAQYKVDGTTAHVSLLEGGSISFPAELVERVESVPHEAVENHLLFPQEATQPNAGSLPATQPPQAKTNPDPLLNEDSIDAMIRSAAKRHQLEPDLLAAVIAVESGYDPSAVSPKGAQGLMQLMPGTAKDLLVTNPFDPRQNIEAGAKYLRQLLDLHNGSFVDALAAYNAGRGRVARYNGVPPYRETIAYINKVLKRYRTPQAVPTSHAASRAGR